MWNAYRHRLALPAALLLLLAGCAAQTPVVVSPTPPPTVVATPPPEPAPVEPPPALPAVPASTPARIDIAIVLDGDPPAHAAVAAELATALSPRLYRVERFAAADAAALDALRDREVVVVAIGDAAVRAARTALPAKPLVFCQVSNPSAALQAGGPIWGVQSLPPLALQLKSWQAIDPSLRTIALIVSTAGAALAAEAQRAASALAADLVVETSASDRETLYLFRRIATSVDGLWLLPDNDALSPAVLRELLSYASSRRIGVLTFNDALLSRGALLTAEAVPADVAATVQRVVERVVADRTAELPSITPLSAAELTINTTVASTLGLPPMPEQSWIVREPD